MPTKKLCYLAELRLRELRECNSPATYRCEIQLSNGRTLVRYICSEHTQRISGIVAVELARLYKGVGTPVSMECFRLNSLETATKRRLRLVRKAA